MMKFQMWKSKAIAIGCLSIVLLFALVPQRAVEAASECNLKCFVTEDGARVCIVEGHRLYDQVTVRLEDGDQCFSSVEQARAANFMVVGAPEETSADTQSAPEVIPAETPEVQQEETPEPDPEPAPETEQPEPEQAVEIVAPESSEAPEEQPQDTVEPVVEEAPSASVPDDGMSQADSEKQDLMGMIMDDSLSMEQREQAYQQLINRPDLSEEERQGIEMAWNFVGGGGMNDLAIEMLKGLLLGPVGIGLLVIVLFFVVCGWIIFAKADVPGWLSLIPIVNMFFMVKISGKPAWWFILLFIPIVQIIISLLISLGLAERFGKGALMGLVLFFLPFIGLPILAFSGEYQG